MVVMVMVIVMVMSERTVSRIDEHPVVWEIPPDDACHLGDKGTAVPDLCDAQGATPVQGPLVARGNNDVAKLRLDLNLSQIGHGRVPYHIGNTYWL